VALWQNDCGLIETGRQERTDAPREGEWGRTDAADPRSSISPPISVGNVRSVLTCPSFCIAPSRPPAPRASVRSGNCFNRLWSAMPDIPTGRMSGHSVSAALLVVTVVVPGESDWRLSKAAWGHAECRHRRGIGIIVRVSSACFRFAFDRGASP
jgi:hypothetical protein